MDKLKITMPGAGSGFVLSVAEELLRDPIFAECEFMLYDPETDRLAAAVKAVSDLFTQDDIEFAEHTADDTDSLGNTGFHFECTGGGVDTGRLVSDGATLEFALAVHEFDGGFSDIDPVKVN